MVKLGQLPEGNSVQRMFAATAIHAPDFATNLLGLGGTFQVGGGAQLTSLTTFVLRPRVRVTAPSSNVANRRKGCWKVSSCKSSYPQWGVYLVACNRHCPMSISLTECQIQDYVCLQALKFGSNTLNPNFISLFVSIIFALKKMLKRCRCAWNLGKD